MISLISILKVNLLIAVLILLYAIFMRNSKSFTANRLLLNLIPLLALMMLFIPEVGQKGTFVVNLPEYVVNATLSPENTSDSKGINTLFLIWIIGLSISFSLSVRKLILVRRMFGEKETGLGAFSFLNRVHIDSSIEGGDKELMFDHEMVHIHQAHSLDLIWYECWKVIFWFNPAIYAGQYLLKEQHEYLADEIMMNENMGYVEFLLAHSFGVVALPLSNEFKGISIKNRIDMITKEKTLAQSLRWFSGILVAAFAMMCMSWTNFEGVPNLGLPIDVAKEKVYEKVDEMPKFPGCENEKLSKKEMKSCAQGKLIEFMIAEVKYPKAAAKEGIEGKTLVKFIVSKDGSIRNAEVLESSEPSLDAEALRVVNAMPNWIPGIHEGKKVNVSIVLPISFAL
ncbi:MAG: TonB family protein [Flavobacteriales bacterium]|nr:TonB family protein [Flavobacteriales bacterium]